MQAGVLIPAAGPKATPENIVKVAGLAERLGYHSVWVTDHVILPHQVESFYPYRANGRWDYPATTNWLDPLLALSWAGAVAPSLRLGTSVLVAPMRNPVLLAKQVATLDHLSGGRVELGLGAGWMEEEFDLVGAAFADRGSRLVEMVELMRTLWSGATVDFQGRYWQVSGAQMYPRPMHGSVPIAFGGHTEAALRRVARIADAWQPTQISIDQLRDGIRRLRTYCEARGRDPDSVALMARPGNVYEVNAQTHAIHQELGIDHVILDTVIMSSDMSELVDKMHGWAELIGLHSRERTGERIDRLKQA
jgi:probable F420-dependent oxidoreductase